MRTILLIVFFFLSANLQANISVSPMVIDLAGKDADTEMMVKNFDNKHNAYVEITAYRLHHPENPAGTKTRVRNPEKEGLVVFPAKLILLPGQTQFVRIVKTAKNLISDQVYQIEFIPKVATQLVNQTQANGSTLGIRVIVGYGARVTLRPDNASPALSMKRVNASLTIKNTGNTSLTITSCKYANERREITLPVYTLFAGHSISVSLNKSSPVTLEATLMNKSLGAFHSN